MSLKTYPQELSMSAVIIFIRHTKYFQDTQNEAISLRGRQYSISVDFFVSYAKRVVQKGKDELISVMMICL